MLSCRFLSAGSFLQNNFTLPEVNVDPLGDMLLDYLIEKDAETPYLDYKILRQSGENL